MNKKVLIVEDLFIKANYLQMINPSREKEILVTLDIARFLHENSLLALPKTVANTDFRDIIGKEKALLEVPEQLEIVAPTDTSVMILGESRTGKEKIADYIHQLSPRKAKPFIKANCAALPPMLTESESFGHEKGAFTGACDKRMGKFEHAAGGTVFLDKSARCHWKHR